MIDVMDVFLGVVIGLLVWFAWSMIGQHIAARFRWINHTVSSNCDKVHALERSDKEQDTSLHYFNDRIAMLNERVKILEHSAVRVRNIQRGTGDYRKESMPFVRDGSFDWVDDIDSIRLTIADEIAEMENDGHRSGEAEVA